jgi:hypothetical protein
LGGSCGLDAKLEDTGDGIRIREESRLCVIIVVCEDGNRTDQIINMNFIKRAVEINSTKHFNDDTECTRLTDMMNIVGVHGEC